MLVPPKSRAGESITLEPVELVGKCREAFPKVFSMVEKIAPDERVPESNPVTELRVIEPLP